jgi:hypothetical protein
VIGQMIDWLVDPFSLSVLLLLLMLLLTIHTYAGNVALVGRFLNTSMDLGGTTITGASSNLLTTGFTALIDGSSGVSEGGREEKEEEARTVDAHKITHHIYTHTTYAKPTLALQLIASAFSYGTV